MAEQSKALLHHKLRTRAVHGDLFGLQVCTQDLGDRLIHVSQGILHVSLPKPGGKHRSLGRARAS